MKKYEVILTESEMRKLKLFERKVNDDDVDDVKFGKTLRTSIDYLRKMIIQLLKSETDFKIKKINANNNVVVKKSYETCYIIFDDEQISLIFVTEKDLDNEYNIDDYNDRGRNGLETLAKTIVSYLEEVM
jgi:chromosome condensin MukBEF MukE localization factor